MIEVSDIKFENLEATEKDMWEFLCPNGYSFPFSYTYTAYNILYSGQQYHTWRTWQCTLSLPD